MAPVAVAREEGEARWWFQCLAVIKATAADTGGQMTIVEVTEPPGAEAPPHVHHREQVPRSARDQVAREGEPLLGHVEEPLRGAVLVVAPLLATREGRKERRKHVRREARGEDARGCEVPT